MVQLIVEDGFKQISFFNLEKEEKTDKDIKILWVPFYWDSSAPLCHKINIS